MTNLILNDTTAEMNLRQTVLSDAPVASNESVRLTDLSSSISGLDLDFAGDSGTGSVLIDSQTFTINTGNGLTTAASNQTLTITGDHDALPNFVANEHVDHTSVSISAGGILSGGGDISSNRTITLSHSDVDHDQTTNFVANEHIDWTGASVNFETSGNAIANIAYMGASAFANYAQFGHKDFAGATGSYAMLQNSSGDTFINAASGRNIKVRINNSDVVYIQGSTGYVGFKDSSPSYQIDNNGTFRTTGAGYFDSTLEVTGQTDLNGGLDVTGISDLGDGGTTNYISISATGDQTFNGSAGFYPRRVSQAAAPASGTGSTQIDVGELIIWRDSDWNDVYIMYNDTDEGIVSRRLT